MSPLLQFFLSALLSWISVLILLPILQKRVLDIPNERSSHTAITPRGGGIGFVLVATVLNYFFSSGPARWIPIFSIPLALVGFVDDIRGVSPGFRYCIQLFTASAIILSMRQSVTALSFFFLIFFLTALINFFNFMDGLDGLVAGSATLLFIGSSSWSLAGAVFGFFLWNWNPARIFMGDTGSTFIGAVFGGLVLQKTTGSQMITCLLMAFPILADSSSCLIRRLISRDNIFQPHRKHLYQRLYMAGWSHTKISSLYILGVGLLVLTKHFGSLEYLYIVLVAELLVGLYLDSHFAISFNTCESS